MHRAEMNRYVMSGILSLLMTFITALIWMLMASSAYAGDTRIAAVAKPAAAAPQTPSIDRGRYLVKITGCNDCHTPGFAQANGQVDERQWLTGDQVGWQGPWGTTFAINLRLFADKMTEEQWVVVTRNSKARPPMPGWVFKDLTEQDLRSMYRFIRSLGPAGNPAPDYLPPGAATQLPVVKFPL